MASAISTISASPMPREVTAGVPIWIPLVLKGLRSSPGTVFLFRVICALSSAFLSEAPGEVWKVFTEVNQAKVILCAPGDYIVALFQLDVLQQHFYAPEA